MILEFKTTPSQNTEGLIKIAFMVGDFASPYRLKQLSALCRHLPSDRFYITLISNDPKWETTAGMPQLLIDDILLISDKDDAHAVDNIREKAPDILIDMDAYGPLERLAVFLAAPVSHKILWGEAPMPPISPDVSTFSGARFDLKGVSPFPIVELPEMGEYCDLPEFPFLSKAAQVNIAAPVLGCLTPANGIGRNGWRLFAEVLRQHPTSRLFINLKDLGKPAQVFITKQFAQANIASERLEFVHAHTAEDLCHYWQSIDIGLAAPVNAGDLALPACLWMGKPYLCLASPLPWSRRPATLLDAVDKTQWIAPDEARYIELALRLTQNPPSADPTLRDRLQALGLTDPVTFAQGFADTLSDLHETTPNAP
jgi:predicted O-linked N-acetylglucosamine transferase (SPINDLY family)